jgi:hypothetical protein
METATRSSVGQRKYKDCCIANDRLSKSAMGAWNDEKKEMNEMCDHDVQIGKLK